VDRLLDSQDFPEAPGSTSLLLMLGLMHVNGTRDGVIQGSVGDGTGKVRE
jgi:hypothetical protein